MHIFYVMEDWMFYFIIPLLSAIRVLSYFYEIVYVFCPSSSVANLQIMFSDINVQFITYDKWYESINTNNEWPTVSECWYDCAIKILYTKEPWITYVNTYNDLKHIQRKEDALHHWENFGKIEGRIFDTSISDGDIFVTGDVCRNIGHYVSMEKQSRYNYHKFCNKISHDILINYCNDNLQNDNLTTPWGIIDNCYKDIHLNLSIYFYYFHIPSTIKSIELYQSISTYKLVFLHFISSCGESTIPTNEWSHIYNESYLIINPDKNHYDSTESPIKYNLANKYLNLLTVDYIDIIYNASDIYVCDSCFACIVYPLRITNRLKAENVIIYDRYYPTKTCSTPIPVNLSRK